MVDARGASSLGELESSVSSSRPDLATDAAVRAFRGNVPWPDVVRTAARAAASRYDSVAAQPPHGLAALGAAVGLQDALDVRHRALAILQAIALLASETKAPAVLPSAPRISGEVAHLGRSALLAFRSGHLEDAESVFLGIVEEGWERRMAGEILFRAAVEDPGESGHKLLTSVALWRLARGLGFRDAHAILRPAVRYLVKGEADRRPYNLTLSCLEKETVDLETLMDGVRPLDEPGRGRLATALATPTDESCIASVLDLLRGGYAASSLAEGLVVFASQRLLGAGGSHPELVHGLLFTHAAHFVVEFSRSSDRAYALFVAALGAHSSGPAPPSGPVPAPQDAEAGLPRIAEDLESRHPGRAAADVRAYLDAGHEPRPLISLLASHAVDGLAQENRGHHLLLADACIQEYATSRAPVLLIALAQTIAASPRDVAASQVWMSALGP